MKPPFAAIATPLAIPAVLAVVLVVLATLALWAVLIVVMLLRETYLALADKPSALDQRILSPTA